MSVVNRKPSSKILRAIQQAKTAKERGHNGAEGYATCRAGEQSGGERSQKDQEDGRAGVMCASGDQLSRGKSV